MPLPAILDEGSVLGPLAAPFAVVAHDRDDLVLVLGIRGDQTDVVHAIGVGEVPGLLVGRLLQRTEAAQVDGTLATPSMEPLQGGSVLRADGAKRSIRPVG